MSTGDGGVGALLAVLVVCRMFTCYLNSRDHGEKLQKPKYSPTVPQPTSSLETMTTF